MMPHTYKTSIIQIIAALFLIIAAGLYSARGVVSWIEDRYAFPLGEKYRAVFLDNGQVYFGKIVKQEPAYLHLANIYYLQLREPLQGGEAVEADTSASDLALIKLGNELHGPEDKMTINRERILFIETLKEDSKVVQAIRSHRAQ